jgi:hypothetical protein
MGSNSQGFDKGQLINPELAGLMQKINSHRQERLHAPIGMNSKNTEALAAVSSASMARDANAAVDVGINRAEIAGLDTFVVSPNLNDLARQFVPEYAGIGIRGVATRQSMEITATHTDSSYSDKRLSNGSFGGRELSLNQVTWSFQYDLPHELFFRPALYEKLLVQPNEN